MSLEVIPVLHNVSSTQRVVDMARLVYSLGIESLVVTKAYGGGAQSGVPEAMRISLKANKRLIVLPDLRDAVELLKPGEVYIVSYSMAEELIDPASPPGYEGRVLIAFNGGEPDFTPSEASLGKPVYIKGVRDRIGALGEASILLYALTRRGGV